MTARTRHLARHGGLTGPEHAVDVLCGTAPRRPGDSLWATAEESEVTCKRCLKALTEIEAETTAVAAKLIELGMTPAKAAAAADPSEGAAKAIELGYAPAGFGDFTAEEVEAYHARQQQAFHVVLDEADEEERAAVAAVILPSLYSTEAYLTPTGPLVERHDVIVPNSFGDRDIATRHGLQRFEVENAINDGWLKR